MRRLPIRLRVTLVFALVMAGVLALTGFVVYHHQRSSLDEAIDRDLNKRAAALAAALRVADVGIGEPARSILRDRQLGFSQVLTARGHLFDPRHQFGKPVLNAAEVAAADSAPLIEDRGRLHGFHRARARLLASPIRFEHHSLITVVSASLADRDGALADLRTVLLAGMPVALLVAALAAYATVAAALRPVEAMRARAGEISDAAAEHRLPVPAARDELRRLGMTLNSMLDRIEAALEREREFVDDASHELRTPLAAQRAELEMALRYASSEDELRAAIRSAAQESERLAALAEGLLLLARADKAGLVVEPRPLAVDELLAAVAARSEARVRAAGRSLTIANSDGLAVRGDRDRLEQALGDLVENALVHGGGGIALAARAAAGRVEIHVRDDGPGFPPEFIAHAFERFRQADAARASEGTGLGLAIVAAIAAAHGGGAHAANRPEGGADVWLEVPAARS